MMGFDEYVLGVLQLAALIGMAAFTAVRLQRRFCERPTRAERALAVAILTWLHLTFATLALGALGALSVPWLLGLLAVIASAAAWVTRSPLVPPRGVSPPWRDRLGDGSLIALYAFGLCYFADRALRHPLLATDALRDHMPRVAEWIQTGSFAAVDASLASLPGAGESLLYVLAAPFENDLFVGLAPIAWLVIQGLAVHRIAIRAGAPPQLARFVPALYLFTPFVARLSWTATMAPALGAALLAAAAFAFDTIAERKRADLVLAFVSLALSIGLFDFAGDYRMIVSAQPNEIAPEHRDTLLSAVESGAQFAFGVGPKIGALLGLVLLSRRLAPHFVALVVAVCVAADLLTLKIYLPESFRLAMLVIATGAVITLLLSHLRPPALPRRIAAALFAVGLIAAAYYVHAAREAGRSRAYRAESMLYRNAATRYADGWAALDVATARRRRQRVMALGTDLTYPLYGPRLDRRVHRAGPTITHEQWGSELRRVRPEWIVVHREAAGGASAWPKPTRWIEEESGGFEAVYRDNWTRVYRVRTKTPP